MLSDNFKGPLTNIWSHLQNWLIKHLNSAYNFNIFIFKYLNWVKQNIGGWWIILSNKYSDPQVFLNVLNT